MVTILILFALMIAFDLIALLRGFDSRDSFDSSEWERLHQWSAFH